MHDVLHIFALYVSCFTRKMLNFAPMQFNQPLMSLFRNGFLKRCAAFAGATSFFLNMAAIPAVPTPVSVKMPDGSTLSVRLHGDEHGHFVTSTDGYLLKQDAKGFYNYAVADAAGNLVAGTVRARNVELRTAAERMELASIDRESLVGMQLEKLARESAAMRSVVVSPMMAPSSRATSAGDLEYQRQAMRPTTPSTGTPHLLVILVEFDDTKFITSDPHATFNRVLNEEGYSDDGATGSVRDYFIASSAGAYEPTIDLYGPVTVSKNSAYYAGSNGSANSMELVAEACALIDDDVDFSVYDCDGDGTVDNVYIYYAGYGQADSGDKSTIWPHSYQMYNPTYFDDVRLGNYTCSNELMGGTTRLAGIGTFCHEFSHALGLPDLYATDYSHTNTPGQWSIMDQGSYNNNSRTPPLHSAYERWVLGWLAPDELATNMPADVALRPATDGGYRDAKVVKTTNRDEFFVIENRQQTGWDQYLPGHGMLLWHIDYDAAIWWQNKPNNNIDHQCVDIVEASGLAGAASFPGSAGVTFHSMKAWNGKTIGLEIDGIYEAPSGNITFMVNGGNPAPASSSILKDPAVDANRVTLSWNPVKDVEFYLISVYRDGYLPVVENFRVFDTSYFSELQEETDYTYRVVWMIGGDAYYSEGRFSTGWRPISEFAVEAQSASAIDDNSCVATWLPLRRAASYTVEVAACEVDGSVVLTEDFTDRKLHNEAWSTDAPFYTTRYGKAAPSVSLKDPSQTFTIGMWERPIQNISLYMTSNGALSSVQVYVEVADRNGNWTEVFNFRPSIYSSTDKTKGIVTFGTDVLGEDAWAMRLSIDGTVNWVVLDDITVTYGESLNCTDIGIDPVTTGDVTMLELTALEPGTTYAYRVVAHENGVDSQPSKWIPFTTAEAAGIGDIYADDDAEGGDNAWYTVTGLRLGERPAVPGLYIHRRKVVRIP